MKSLSIIVPTYNLATYVQPLLARLAEQTQPIELLLVDDGSTDETPAILADFAQHHAYAKVLGDGLHRGVAYARNLGLRAAQGDAVAFVDGDDLIAKDFAKALLGGFAPGVAAVAVAYNWYSMLPAESNRYQFLSQQEMFEQVSHHGTEVGGYVWNKAFSRQAIMDIDLQFEMRLRIAEDYLFTARFVAETAKRYAYLPKVMYIKRSRPGSIIHSATAADRRQENAVFDRIRQMRELIR